MVRHLIVLAVMAFCLAAASVEKTHTADKVFLDKQMKIFELLWRPEQATEVLPEMKKLADAWDFKANIEKYVDKSIVLKFLERWEHGMLPRGEVFSMFYKEQREETIALFHLFHCAKDFDTFYNTAVWARFHINEIQFIYTLSIAVLHHPDLKHIVLPPMYEVIPHFYFNDEVIYKAQNIRYDSSLSPMKTASGVDVYVLPANYSSWYIRHTEDDEWKLNYLTEDIGWDSFYFFARSEFPFWMSTEEFGLPKNKRGEHFYFLHRQMLNRYNLERSSNDMGEIEYFDWNKPFITGYYPTMSLPNGLPFPQRESWSEFPINKWKYIDEIEEYEARVNFAIDSGYIFDKEGKFVNIYTPEGFEILGSIIEGNYDSYNKRFYGSLSGFAKMILGFNVDPSTKYHVVPSALDYIATSVRDPAFYRIFNRILSFFYKYKSHLPVYTRDELLVPGVSIESFTVDKMVTFFDHFDATINNAVMVKDTKDARSFLVKTRQHRLNHKPYSFHLSIKSDKAMKGVIRVFLGPKYDVHHNELNIAENWMNFLELDQWMVDVKPGINEFERSSHESIYAVADELNYESLVDKVKKALEGVEKFTYNEQYYGLPDRLMLPKGKVEGMPFQLFAYFSQVDEAHLFKVDSPVWGKKVFDGKPMGYPLDRPMYAFNFTVPNMHFSDVVIYHKESHDINVTV